MIFTEWQHNLGKVNDMRLIDADALLKMKFSNGMNDDGLLYVPFGEVMRNIKEAPTVYDVNKVLQHLESEIEDADSEPDDERFFEGKSVGLGVATIIVKAGGIDG